MSVTALLTMEQVCQAVVALQDGAPACISVFAGRVADTGVDPVPLMADAAGLLHAHPQMALIWAHANS